MTTNNTLTINIEDITLDTKDISLENINQDFGYIRLTSELKHSINRTLIFDKQGDPFFVMPDNQYLTQLEVESGKEFFKKIGKYTLLSSKGYVYNLNRCTKNYGKDNNFGYMGITANGRTTTMNNLVYRAFVGGIPEGYVIHHLNHNPYDNAISNLAMITRGENLAERFKFNQNLGKEMAKKRNNNYIYDRTSKTLYKNKAEIARSVKGLIAGVTACLDGRFQQYKDLDIVQLTDKQMLQVKTYETEHDFLFFSKDVKKVKISQITF